MAAATGESVSVNRVLKPAVTMPCGLPSQAMEPGRISNQRQSSQSQAQPPVALQTATTANHAQSQSQARPDAQAVVQSQNQPQSQQPTTQLQSTCASPNVGRHVQITGPEYSNQKPVSVKQAVTAPLTQLSCPALSQLPSTASTPTQAPAQNQPLPHAQPSTRIIHSNIRPCANITGNAHPFLYGADEEDDEFESYDSTYGSVGSFQMGTSNPMYAAIQQHLPHLLPPTGSSNAARERARQMGQRTPAQILSAMGPGPSRSKSRTSTGSNSSSWGRSKDGGARNGGSVVLRGKVIYTPSGVKPPPLAKMKSLTAFLEGKTFERIAVEKSIKLNTCQ